MEVKQKEVNAEKIEVETILEEIKIASEKTDKLQKAAVAKKKELDYESAKI